MKLASTWKILGLVLSVSALGSVGSYAAILPTPYPAFVNADTEAEVFVVPDQALSVNLSNPFGAVFGFYYVNTGHMVTVFKGSDPSVLSIDPAIGTFASIDFSSGLGSGHITTSFFVLPGVKVFEDTDFATEAGDIGFFLRKPEIGTIFSEASRNPRGADLVGIFPSKVTSPSDFVIGFYAPTPFIGHLPLSGSLLATQGFRPIAAPIAATIPEPSVYAMLLIGLGLLGFTVRKRKINLNADT